MADLALSNLTVTAGRATLVRNATLRLRSGEIVALIGPNGAGKTSLLRAALGLIRATGTATLDGRDVAALTPIERARAIAYLPQHRPLAWNLSVRAVCALGRFAYGAPPARLSPADSEAVDAALAACDLTALTDRAAPSLSGGELARLHLARALAASTPLLIADEPIAALDPRHQLRVLDILKAYRDRGGGALVVLHDLNFAARIADRLVWMRDGHIVADGPTEETLTSARLAEIYNVRATVSGRDVRIDGAA
jgi:iron complex transport system ATP-binding protein